jgi:hypothetical protein
LGSTSTPTRTAPGCNSCNSPRCFAPRRCLRAVTWPLVRRMLHWAREPNGTCREAGAGRKTGWEPMHYPRPIADLLRSIERYGDIPDKILKDCQALASWRTLSRTQREIVRRASQFKELKSRADALSDDDPAKTSAVDAEAAERKWLVEQARIFHEQVRARSRRRKRL